MDLPRRESLSFPLDWLFPTTDSKEFVAVHKIPVYATYFGYSKLVVPFLLGGRDPLKGVFGLFSGVASPGGSPGSAGQAGAAAGQPEMSKRQAKLQKRAERGDPRVAQQQQQARRR